MKLRLDRDLARALDEALAAARRARHAAVTREHVLEALLGFRVLWRDVLPLRASQRELASLIEIRLAELPTTAPYRDAIASVPFSEELQADLNAAQRAFFFPRKIGVEELLDVLLDAPEIARLVADARLDLDVLDNSISEARRIAFEHRHAALSPEHLFRVFADERWFARALLEAGGEAEAFRLRLDERLAALGAVPQRDHEILPTRALGGLIQRAGAHGRMLGRPTTSEIFVAIALLDAEPSHIIEDTGVDRMTFLSSIVHGFVPSLDTNGAAGLAEVVFHNDDFTTQELVIATLEEQFGLADVLAVDVMLRIHQNGEAVVGVYHEADARERARDATERARSAAFPLRIEVRPIRGGHDDIES